MATNLGPFIGTYYNCYINKRQTVNAKLPKYYVVFTKYMYYYYTV